MTGTASANNSEPNLRDAHEVKAEVEGFAPQSTASIIQVPFMYANPQAPQASGRWRFDPLRFIPPSDYHPKTIVLCAFQRPRLHTTCVCRVSLNF